ncbi:acyltransferase [Vibrio fortis]|uniref:acyltransferase n=1 Tax=Vibrio fortis TaxID=212667 RepID=UPI004068C282
MSFYSEEEVNELGFKSIGKNVKISRKASIYNADNIEIGDNSRIDDFCILSAGEFGIVIGRNVHIACFCSLIGNEEIELKDFSGLSSRVSIYSSSDDYMGNAMTNPTVPIEYTNVTNKKVTIGKHSIVGAGSVVLPGVNIGEGCAIGALSLVKKNCDEWVVYGGAPLKKLVSRKRKCLELEVQYLEKITEE